MHLVFLLEEASMENVLEIILEKLAGKSTDHTWETHPHQGKADLLKKLPKKLHAYGTGWLAKVYSDYRIVVIVDQNGQDCRELKRQIIRWAKDTGLEQYTLVRIAVAALEAWFLGDVEALENAFPKLRRLNLGGKANYRDPDGRPDPARDLDREMTEVSYGKYSRAKGIYSLEIACHLNLAPEHNHSRSFQVTLEALRTLLG